MEAFAAVKQPRFFNGDSLESSAANICIYVYLYTHLTLLIQHYYKIIVCAVS